MQFELYQLNNTIHVDFIINMSTIILLLKTKCDTSQTGTDSPEHSRFWDLMYCKTPITSHV